MSARTPEGKVKEKVKEFLAKIGEQYPGKVWYCMPLGQMYGKRGVPDFVLCVNGNFLAIETKAEGGKLSAMQKMELGKIAAAGGHNLVVYPDTYADMVRMVHELAEFGNTGVENSINIYGHEAVR